MYTLQQRIHYCSNTIFVYDTTENEVESVIKSLKVNSSAGYDETPEFLIKHCIHYIKKTITPYLDIIGASFNSGILPDKMKIAEVRSLFKKGLDKMSKITDQYPFYQFFFFLKS